MNLHSTPQPTLSRKPLTLVVLAFLMLLVVACSFDHIEVTANFANTSDIKEGTAVFFNQKQIGEVSDVVTQQDGSRVALSLDKAAVAEVYAESAVVVNRLKEGTPLEIVNRETAQNLPLQDGQEIQGLDSMVQLGAWAIGDALQVGVGAISDYVNSFQDYLQSEEFQTEKDQIEIEINGAAVSAEQALQTLGEELNNVITELAENEDEIAAAVDNLSAELAPVAEELAKSGARLSTEMEKFAQSLESSDAADRQAGQRVIESIIAMLENLSASLEQGAEEVERANAETSKN